jgi:hypothetical protein
MPQECPARSAESFGASLPKPHSRRVIYRGDAHQRRKPVLSAKRLAAPGWRAQCHHTDFADSILRMELTNVVCPPRPAGHATVGPCPDNSYGCSSVIDPRNPRAEVLPIVNFANCTGTCSVPITGFMSVYILGVGRWGSYVQNIGMVIRNSVGSVTALNNAAMGDVMLVQSKSLCRRRSGSFS